MNVGGQITLIHGNALSIPLADQSVHLIVTSPPYWAQRSYRDDDEHMDGQLGDESTPHRFLASLWAAMDECWRVLRDDGSCWVNLGDKYCVDPATEMLTQRGWLSWDQVEAGDIALTLNPDTHLAEWQPVTAVNVFHDQRCDMLSVEGRAHSSLTTGNHRWLIERRTSDNYVRRYTRTETTSAELLSDDRVPLIAPVVNLPTEAKYTDALVEAVAWYWTEGHDRKPGVGRTQTTGIYIGQSQRVNPHKVARIRRCLTDLFGSAAERLPGVKNADPTWAEYFWPHMGDIVDFRLNAAAARVLREHAPDKVPSSRFLSDLTASQLVLFIDASMAADGHWRRGAGALAQSDRRRAESFQMACALAGWATSLTHDERAIGERWVVELRISRNFRPRRQQSVRWVEYEGTVWCPTTTNGSWYARRNGKTYFTGNSGSGGNNNAGVGGSKRGPDRYNQNTGGLRKKSRMGLPHGFARGLVDPTFRAFTERRAGVVPMGVVLRPSDYHQWINRMDVVWSKVNHLPESAVDRVQSAHEFWFHLTKSDRYFSSLDAIREPHADSPGNRYPRKVVASDVARRDGGTMGIKGQTTNTITADYRADLSRGKTPGSVWEVVAEPLVLPDDLPDHYAPFPSEFPRRIVLGWSPCGGTVLDPFSGTGTTAVVAAALGRHGIGVDLSWDYHRIARWRADDPRLRCKVLGVEKPEPVLEGQLSLLDGGAA